MKTSTRAAGLAATVVAAVVLGAAGFAWACTPQARVSGMSPDSGTPGSKTTLSAENFTPGPVEIRWNSIDGRELGTAAGPNFSVTVTIPNVAPDFYTIVAVQRNGTSIVGKASARFEVTPASASESGGYRYGGSGQTGQADQRSATEASTGGSLQPSGGDSVRSGGSAPVDARSYGNGGAAFGPDPSAPSAQSGVAAGQTGTGPAARSASGAAAPGQVPAGAADVPAVAAEVDQAVSPRAGLADLWSGFEADRSRTGASLTEAAPVAGGTTPVAAGAALLSLGLLALFAGFGVAELSRRRAVADVRR